MMKKMCYYTTCNLKLAMGASYQMSGILESSVTLCVTHRHSQEVRPSVTHQQERHCVYLRQQRSTDLHLSEKADSVVMALCFGKVFFDGDNRQNCNQKWILLTLWKSTEQCGSACVADSKTIPGKQ